MSDPTAGAQATARDVLAGHLARYGGCECGAEQPEWAPSDQWWRRHYVDVLAAAGCLAPAAPSAAAAPAPACTTDGCEGLPVTPGLYDDHDDRARVAYCDECAAALADVCTPDAAAASPTDDALVEADALAAVRLVLEWHYGDGFDHENVARAVLASPGMIALRERAAALDRVLALHVSEDEDYEPQCVACRAECLYCDGDHRWPCPTVLAARSAAPTEEAGS